MPTTSKQDADALAMEACKELEIPYELTQGIALHFSQSVAVWLEQAVCNAEMSVGGDGISFLEKDSLSTMMQCSWEEIADEAIASISLNADGDTDDVEEDLQTVLRALRSTADRIESECRKILPTPS